MTSNFKITLFLLIAILVIGGCSSESDYYLSDNGKPVNIYVDKNTDPLIVWAANDLAEDIKSITGVRPEIIISNSIKIEKGIYIGKYNDALMHSLNMKQVNSLKEAWEKFHVNVYNGNLIIAGSDVRGTVYGIFDMAERVGISPWKWWADVKPIHRGTISLKLEKDGITENPSVQYRGIFLNDEIWGLRPWASSTFDPEAGVIGPKTYEKIFQLLLRLKANAIWPAMHHNTKAFYFIPGNKEMAARYKIVVGTSHAEPMMRNNLGEWDSEKYGAFNYFTNSEAVRQYWSERIKEVRNTENIITLGMRGVSDGQMRGGESLEEKKHMLEKIIDDQRSILQGMEKGSLDSIQQTIVLYKEVLNLYDLGVEIPEDVTLMWCDNNHGYIRRLSNEKEQKRKGGSGVYYHLSYWGTPHDYLWLSTTQPGLIWEEMSKAYANGAQRIWIANVGDIKPAEYNIELFLDLAWNINSISNTNLDQHMRNWAAREFGEEVADDVTKVMTDYYRLAFIRRPEFMGWSKVEPQTPTMASQFNSNANGNELVRRIKMYDNLSKEVEEIKEKVPPARLDAFFQLIEYPVKAAGFMNSKFLYAQISQEEADTIKAEDYVDLSRNSFKQIEKLTEQYNTKISGGKWNLMMSMNPRNLKVFDMPGNIIAKKNLKKKSKAFRKQRIFIQASDYKGCQGSGSYVWGSIKQLGYSNASITMFPLKTTYFEKDEQPYVEYVFNAKEAGAFELQVRCLPTNSNNSDHQLGIQLDQGGIKHFPINTKWKSNNWRQNIRDKNWQQSILSNSKIVKLSMEIEKAGTHSLRLYVNQTGIVIDQLAIDFAMDQSFYEIPTTNSNIN